MMAIMKLSMKKKLIKLYIIQKINNILSCVQNVLGMAPLSGKLPSNIAHSVSKPAKISAVKERLKFTSRQPPLHTFRIFTRFKCRKFFTRVRKLR